MVKLYSVICHTTSYRIFLVLVRLGTSTDFLVFVPLMSAPPYGGLGTAADYLVFVPHISSPPYGGLGTAVDYLVFVLPMSV